MQDLKKIIETNLSKNQLIKLAWYIIKYIDVNILYLDNKENLNIDVTILTPKQIKLIKEQIKEFHKSSNICIYRTN